MSRLSEIKPLRDYLANKKEMIEQMFLCIEENQLKKMIPDVLKEATLEDIKAECLVELLGMSKKRILGIMDGKELDESSEDSLELSDISEDETPVQNVKKEKKSPDRNKKKKDKESKSSKTSKKIHKLVSSESDDILEIDEEEEEETPPPPKKKKTKKLPPEETPSTKAVKSSKKKQSENIGKDIEKEVEVVVEVEPEKKEGGKNLLEILELEMRARAIRSLIDREEKKNKGVSDEEPSTSDKGKRDVPESVVEEDDNDPDAVIVVDENVALQIDLTKDDSDLEIEESSKVKEKVVPNYRKHNEDIDSDNDVASEKTSNNENNKDTNKKESDNNIKDKDNANSKHKASEEFIPRNWTERWLESNDVQKVMKTSKVLTNLKKRLINVSKQKPQEEKANEEAQDNLSIEGTVKEYSQLQSIKIYNQTIEEGESNSETTTTGNDNEVNQISALKSNTPDVIDDTTSSHLIGLKATTSELLDHDNVDAVNSHNTCDTVDVIEKTQEKAVVIIASPMLYNDIISDKDQGTNDEVTKSDTLATGDNDKTQTNEGNIDNLSTEIESSECVDKDKDEPSRIIDHTLDIQNKEAISNEEHEVNITNESDDILIISEECEIEDKEEETTNDNITSEICDINTELNRETKNLVTTKDASGTQDKSTTRTTPRCLSVKNKKENLSSVDGKKQNDEKLSVNVLSKTGPVKQAMIPSQQ